MQRTAGNRATSALITSTTTSSNRSNTLSNTSSRPFGPPPSPMVGLAAGNLVVQRKRPESAAFEDPPSSGMSAALSGLAFEPAEGAVYGSGPKPPQLVAMVTKRLAGGQYTPAIGQAVYAWGKTHKFAGWGGFKAGTVAAGKEPIGTSLVGLGASLKLVAFLRKKGVKVEITQEQEELLVLGRTTFDLWTDVQTEAKKTGKLLPAWYAKLIFDQEMSQHATLLREYQDALEDHRKGTEGALDRGMTAVRSVLDSIRPPAAALEAIRADFAVLGAAEKTKGGFSVLWGEPTGAEPTKLAGVKIAVLFLLWSRSQPESTAEAPTSAVARAKMLERFFSFGHDVSFTPMTGDQKLRNQPATANARPFDATLTSVPPLQPPLFDAAYGTDHRFTMGVQFPHVTDALALWAYSWERVKIPEDQIGAPVEKLRGEAPSSSEVASVRFGRANRYAKADIERAAKDITTDLGPAGVGAGTLVGANAILRYAGTGVRLALELLTMPKHEKPIVFLEPGLYLVRCAASPVFKGETVLKRAPSVAYYPVLARDPDEMATAGVETTNKRQQAGEIRIAALEAALAKPLPPAVRDVLQGELDTLRLAGGGMGGAFAARMKEIDRYIADIKAGKAEGVLEDVEKQKKQLGKLIARRAERKLGDKAERLNATFVSDTGQRVTLDLEAQDRRSSGGRFAVYISDVTTAKSGAETGYGSTRAAAITNGITRLLEGIAGYGRGRVAVQIGTETKTLRIEASRGSLLMESIESVTMVLSLAAVAAAPFTGGASLALLIPIGIVGAVPSAYRIAVRVEHGTFEPDLESAMDVVNLVGSTVGLGRAAAGSMRMVRVGRAMMFIGFGSDALGGLLMGADLVKKIDELSKLPEGERAAGLLMIIGQAMLGAGIVVGGALAERASQRHAETKARGTTSKASDDVFSKAKSEQDLAALGPMTEETKGLLRGNDQLRTALADHPSAAGALKKCASPCFPPGATVEQVQRLDKLLNRIKETGSYDEAALKDYFHARRDKLDEAMANIEGVKTATDLNQWVAYYNKGRSITKLPPKGDPKELLERSQRAHDLGVKHGQAKAVADSLKSTQFDNPVKGGAFGQGFDDIMYTGASLDVGDVYIVEYKGGSARLAAGQMELAWVVGNIRRLELEGGLVGQAWAQILRKALREGRLRGVAYKTPVPFGSPLPTYKLGSWTYAKTKM